LAAFSPASRPCAPRACGRIRSTADAPDCSCVTSAPWVSVAAKADLTQIQVDSTSWATPFSAAHNPLHDSYGYEDAETRDARGDAGRAGTAVEPVLRARLLADRGRAQSTSDADGGRGDRALGSGGRPLIAVHRTPPRPQLANSPPPSVGWPNCI